MRKRSICSIGGILGVLAPTVAWAAPFTPGNLVIVRTGDSTYVADGSAGTAYLDEYTKGGVLVQSVPLNDGSNTTTPQFALSSNLSTGFMSLSTNGQYLTLGGYHATLGTATVDDISVSGGVPRVVARVDMNTNIDTTTRITDTSGWLSGQEIRSVSSMDGTQFWISGESSSSNRNGIRYTTLGSNTSVRITTNSNDNPRLANIFKDAAGDYQLYRTTGSSSTPISTVSRAADANPKLPTTSVSLTTALFNAGSGESAYDFLFADPNTLYLTNDNNTAKGGIEKWTRPDSVSPWVYQYSLQNGVGEEFGSVSLRGLSMLVDEYGTNVLFATAGSGGGLVRVRDVGAESTFNILAHVGTGTGLENYRFHDVVWLPGPVPEPATAGLLAMGGLLWLRPRRRTV